MPHLHRHLHGIARGIIGTMEENLDESRGDKRDVDKKNKRDDPVGGAAATVIRTVYKTLQPTFEGPVAGYSTLNKVPAPEATPAAQPTNKVAASQPSHGFDVIQSPSIPTAIRQPLSPTSELDKVLEQATGKPILSPSMDIGVPDFTSTSAPGTVASITSSSESTTPQDSGNANSAGAKAGIAFGVIGGVFIVGLVAFLLFIRRRRQAVGANAGADNEKNPSKGSSFDTMAAQRNPNAPRISLRPVTQFLPNWSLDKRTSKAAGAALAPSSAPIKSNGQTNGMRDGPASSQNTHHRDPFGSQAERVLDPTIPEHSTIASSNSITTNEPAMATGAAAGELTRKASMRNGGPKPLDLTVAPALSTIPPSPAGTEFSETSVNPGSAVIQTKGAAAIAAAGGPLNSNVHRVQLDFKPALDDEMEMKAGELVRLLHEYDDGWALCIRLDRSQQGVVPRTCLSARPVKPRSPEGPRPVPLPINHPKGQSPRGHPQRPMTPQGRPMTAQNGHQGQPRMGPSGSGGGAGAGPRPMSASGHGQSSGPQYNNGFAPEPLASPSQSQTRAYPQLSRLPGAPPTTQAVSPPRGPLSSPPSGVTNRMPAPGQAF
ncbi:hypothetical protein E4U45_005773 [Claviceps purpurea]|nr:hypothetical protein E4U45_005773 [Claviceps purpurea]